MYKSTKIISGFTLSLAVLLLSSGNLFAATGTFKGLKGFLPQWFSITPKQKSACQTILTAQNKSAPAPKYQTADSIDKESRGTLFLHFSRPNVKLNWLDETGHRIEKNVVLSMTNTSGYSLYFRVQDPLEADRILEKLRSLSPEFDRLIGRSTIHKDASGKVSFSFEDLDFKFSLFSAPSDASDYFVKKLQKHGIPESDGPLFLRIETRFEAKDLLKSMILNHVISLGDVPST